MPTKNAPPSKPQLKRQNTFYDSETYEAVSVAPPKTEQTFAIFAEQLQLECKKFKPLLAHLTMEKQQIQRELRKFSELFAQAKKKVEQEIASNWSHLAAIDVSDMLGEELARRLSAQRVHSLTPEQLKLISEDDLLKLAKKFGRRGSLAAVLPDLIGASADEQQGAIDASASAASAAATSPTLKSALKNKGVGSTVRLYDSFPTRILFLTKPHLLVFSFHFHFISFCLIFLFRFLH